MALIGRRAWRAGRRPTHRSGLALAQTVGGVILFNASRREATVVARVSDDYRRGTMAVLRVAFLSSLTLEFFATVSIALVGPSGSGKSTVVNLLLGFIRPDQGRVLIGSTPLDQIDLDSWRRQLAWVPQQPRLFHGSLLDNIRLGRPDATLDEVREAARLARADTFIDRLPLGFETAVGERGQGLSGGQIQRIALARALARALLRNAPLVILDEATASLDRESERLVTEGIEALARERTLLIVAHRLATVRNADRILLSTAALIANVTLMAVSGWFIAAMTIAGTAGVSMNYFTPAAIIRTSAIVRTAGRYGERLVTHEATLRLLASLRVWFYEHLEPLTPTRLLFFVPSCLCVS